MVIRNNKYLLFFSGETKWGKNFFQKLEDFWARENLIFLKSLEVPIELRFKYFLGL